MKTLQHKIKTKPSETSKVKIKVIKKLAATVCTNPVIIEKKSDQTATRDLVSTISNWVNEFQEHRHQETKQALNLHTSRTIPSS